MHADDDTTKTFDTMICDPQFNSYQIAKLAIHLGARDVVVERHERLH